MLKSDNFKIFGYMASSHVGWVILCILSAVQTSTSRDAHACPQPCRAFATLGGLCSRGSERAMGRLQVCLGHEHGAAHFALDTVLQAC